tara:strand:- start:1889 stop:2425 length:537 start_codon:yes stop_codon:yes gene_type:complete
MHIEKRQDVLLKSLKNYYKSNDKMRELLKVLSKDSTISLRLIDYLCTNYAKNNDVVLNNTGKSNPENLYLLYRSQLKAFSKIQFDPFKRHERIEIPCNDLPNGKLETTVAQLNFFRWIIDKKILNWLLINDNLKKVENDMMSVTKTKKKQVSTKAKTKSKQCQKSAKRHNMHITVTFR